MTSFRGTNPTLSGRGVDQMQAVMEQPVHAKARGPIRGGTLAAASFSGGTAPAEAGSPNEPSARPREASTRSMPGPEPKFRGTNPTCQVLSNLAGEQTQLARFCQNSAEQTQAARFCRIPRNKPNLPRVFPCGGTGGGLLSRKSPSRCEFGDSQVRRWEPAKKSKTAGLASCRPGVIICDSAQQVRAFRSA